MKNNEILEQLRTECKDMNTAADRDRAAAALAAALADAVYCDNLAARLEYQPADLATLFNVTAAPTVTETAAKVAKVATKRAKKTA